MCTYLGEFIFLLPEVFLVIAASALLLLGSFAKSYCFKGMNIVVSSFIIIAIYLNIYEVPKSDNIFLEGFFRSNFSIYTVKLILLLASFFYILLYKGQNLEDREELQRYEFPVLILFSLAGMLLLLSSNNFLSFYVSLELQGLCLYILAAFERNNNKSSEAGIKYFVLGSFASGLLLFGISLIYGYSGNLGFETISNYFTVNSTMSLGLTVGIILVLIGIFFKISAAPFHMWTIDVYQGAPTIVTSYFANIVKISTIGFLLIFVTSTLTSWEKQYQPILLLTTMLTVLVGALGGLLQTNIKRLLAYSSISHAGFILLAISSFHFDIKILSYFIIYFSMTLPVFALVMSIRKSGKEIELINDLAGISRSSPVIAFSLAVFLFSLAGIPPFAGFFAKFYVFQNAIASDNYITLIVCIIAAVISAYYYLKIVKVIYFDEPQEEISFEISNLSKIIITMMVMFNLLFIFF